MFKRLLLAFLLGVPSIVMAGVHVQQNDPGLTIGSITVSGIVAASTMQITSPNEQISDGQGLPWIYNTGNRTNFFAGTGAGTINSAGIGHNNTGLGGNACGSLTTGNQITCVGQSAGSGLNSGTDVLIMGYGSQASNNLTNAVVIGDLQTVTSSNTAVIGGPPNSVGSMRLIVSSISTSQIQWADGSLSTTSTGSGGSGGGVAGANNQIQFRNAGAFNASGDLMIHTSSAILSASDVSNPFTTSAPGYGLNLLIKGNLGAPTTGYGAYVTMGNGIAGNAYAFVSSFTSTTGATRYGAFLAATGGANNYALWVDSGQVQINSSTTVSQPVSITAPGDGNITETISGSTYAVISTSFQITSGHLLCSNSTNYTAGDCGGGTGTPGGTNQQLQYSNAGIFGGVANSVVGTSSISYAGIISVSTMAMNTGASAIDAAFKFGTNPARGSNPVFDIGRTVTGQNGGHGFQDSSIINGSNGSTGYGSFNDFSRYADVGPYDHHAGFQSGFSYASTSTINYIDDFLAGMAFDNTGNASIHVDFYAQDAAINSTGRPLTQIDFYVPQDPVAASGFNNWGFYSGGVYNYMRGLIVGPASNSYYINDSTSAAIIVNADKQDAKIRFYESNQNIWDIGATSGTARFGIKDINQTDYLTILTGGHVGINQAAPAATLDVSGITTDAYTFRASTFTAGFGLAVSTNGHVISNGPSPAVSSCGTGSPSVVGDDFQGTITTGGGSPTACTLTFAKTYGVGCGVQCFAQDNSAATDQNVSSPTSVTFTLGVTGTKIYYICTGYGSACR